MLNLAPGAGQFCRESMSGERKAGFFIGLWEHRTTAIECGVSNSRLWAHSIQQLTGWIASTQAISS